MGALNHTTCLYVYEDGSNCAIGCALSEEDLHDCWAQNAQISTRCIHPALHGPLKHNQTIDATAYRKLLEYVKNDYL